MRILRLIGFAVLGFAAFKLLQSHRGKPLFHVILFRFKKDATEQEKQRVETLMMDLKNDIEFINSLESGVNLPHEHRNKGFTHCAIYTFKSKKDFQAYKEHPAHKDFLEKIAPFIEDRLVIDFYPD